MGSDAISREILSELNQIVRHPAGVTELLEFFPAQGGMGALGLKKTTLNPNHSYMKSRL